LALGRNAAGGSMGKWTAVPPGAQLQRSGFSAGDLPAHVALLRGFRDTRDFLPGSGQCAGNSAGDCTSNFADQPGTATDSQPFGARLGVPDAARAIRTYPFDPGEHGAAGARPRPLL